MQLRAELTTEPFHREGDPPPHALAPAKVAETAGLTVELGPLGTSVAGDSAALLSALGQALDAAFAQGATRVTLQVERVDE